MLLRITQAWFLLLIIGSFQPARPAVLVGVHREIHWLAFAGATLLLLCSSRSRRRDLLSAPATLALGLSIEYLQHLISHGTMEWRDVRDDAVAIVIAFALYQMTRGWASHRRPAPAQKNGVSG